MSPGRRQPAEEAGQTLLLILIYAVVVLAVVFTGVSATAVHLARHRLLAVADGAALDAANALDRQRFYVVVGGAGPAPDRVVSLTDASVRDAVQAYLAAAPTTGRLADVRVVDPTGTPDGSTAQVSLETVVGVPWLSGITSRYAGGVTVRVTARARARQVGA